MFDVRYLEERGISYYTGQFKVVRVQLFYYQESQLMRSLCHFALTGYLLSMEYVYD